MKQIRDETEGEPHLGAEDKSAMLQFDVSQVNSKIQINVNGQKWTRATQT